MRRLLPAVFAMLIVTGCGNAAIGTVPSTGDYKVYEAGAGNLVSVIDSRSHAIERHLPLGTASADWKHLYSISVADTSSRLQDTDPATGTVLRSLPLSRQFQLPDATMTGIPGGLSQNGHWLVLQAYDQSGDVTVRSHVMVQDTSFAKPAAQVDLAGDFRFDAISNDGQRLFLIEHLSGPDYRVRVYNVSSGQLDPNVVVDKSDGTAAMQGIRLTGVASHDGVWLYSVYARENKGAFIHALNLDATIAVCIDLPGDGYSSDSSALQWSLALSPDGSHLFATNGGMGVVADVSSASFPSIAKTAHVETSGPVASFFVQDVQAKELGSSGGAVVSHDGRTLVMAGSYGVIWLDAATLHERSRQLTDGLVWSLAPSPDGNTIYALYNDGLIAELSMPAQRVASTFAINAVTQPMALIRVEAAPGP